MRPVATLPVRNDDLVRKALRLAADLVDATARDDMVTLRRLLAVPEDVVVEPETDLDRIIHLACDHFDASPQDVVGGSRTKNTVLARHVACYVACVFGTSYSEVARHLDCHHTSVMHGVNRVRENSSLLDVAFRVIESTGGNPAVLDALTA